MNIEYYQKYLEIILFIDKKEHNKNRINKNWFIINFTVNQEDYGHTES